MERVATPEAPTQEIPDEMIIWTGSSARSQASQLTKQPSTFGMPAKLSRKPTNFSEDGESGILPDEIILAIFNYLSPIDDLPRLGLVCRRWRFISQDNGLWENVDLSARVLKLDNLMAMVLTHSNIKRLNLGHTKLIAKGKPNQAAPYQYGGFGGWQAQQQQLQQLQIPEGFRAVSIWSAMHEYRADLLQLVPDLHPTDSSVYTFLHFIALKLPSLEALCISEHGAYNNSYGLWNYGFGTPGQVIKNFNLRNLRTLNISGSKLPTSHLAAMFRGAENLEVVLAAYCDTIAQQDSIEALVNVSKKLRVLDMAGIFCQFHLLNQLLVANENLKLLVHAAQRHVFFGFGGAPLANAVVIPEGRDVTVINELPSNVLKDVARLQQLGELMTTPHWCNNNGESLLAMACQQGSVATARELVENWKLDVNGIIETGWVDPFVPRYPPCLFASERELRETLRKVSLSPLAYAAESGSLELVQYLLAKGADPSLHAVNANTCLDSAIQRGRKDVVDFLLQDPRVKATSIAVMFNVRHQLGVETITNLVTTKLEFPPRPVAQILADGNERELAQHRRVNEVLHSLCHGSSQHDSDVPLLRMLLGIAFADVNSVDGHGMNAMQILGCRFSLLHRQQQRHYVFGHAQRSFITELLNARPDLNPTIKEAEGPEPEEVVPRTARERRRARYQVYSQLGNMRPTAPPLHFFCEWAEADLIKQIVAAGAKLDGVDERGRHAMFHCITSSNEAAALALLKAGAAISGFNKDEPKSTVLHEAAKYNLVELAEYILENKLVPVDQLDDDGWTALMIAAQNDNVKVARQLVEAGASLTLTDPDTLRPALLHAMLSHLALSTSRYLLKLPGIDVNVIDANGRNALYAEWRGKTSEAIITDLVALGCSLDNKDMNDQTPEEYAEQQTFKRLMAKLKLPPSQQPKAAQKRGRTRAAAIKRAAAKKLDAEEDSDRSDTDSGSDTDRNAAKRLKDGASSPLPPPSDEPAAAARPKRGAASKAGVSSRGKRKTAADDEAGPAEDAPKASEATDDAPAAKKPTTRRSTRAHK